MTESAFLRLRIPCTIMRGGTSKGVIVHRENLPREKSKCDQALLRLFGSPDRRQIDGLGGADPLTSKVAIVGSPTRPDADIDYTFGQIGIERAYVDYAGYCGNILTGVAAYAVDEGFVSDKDNNTVLVRINTTNANRIVRAEVPTQNGRFLSDGELAIAGVPGTGSAITVNFADTLGSTTGRALPSGNVADHIAIPGYGSLEVSVVDVGNPMIFASLSEFGATAADGPEELDQRHGLIEQIELIRQFAARKFGLTVADGLVSENVPLVALVGPPDTYTAYGSSELVAANAVDLVSREFFAGKLHKAYGIGESVCTAAAVAIEGTIPNRVARVVNAIPGYVCLGHPSGQLSVEVVPSGGPNEPAFERIAVVRTARRILDGTAFV